MTPYDIVTSDGDGIGPEVCQSAVTVLPADTYAACRAAHAVLHGAADLPGITYPDGTEVGNDLHLRLRARLDL